MIYYISFASDKGFLGGCVVEASSPEGALEEARKRGINPGGDAAILEAPEGMSREQVPMPFNVLMTKEQIGECVEGDEREQALDEAVHICQGCNEHDGH